MFYHKNFSRGCATHPLSLKTRFSLYHIKVLHLFANRLRCREPRAAGGADTSLAWYQLRARKRATFAKKNRDTFADSYLARYLIVHGG